jgi:hypothetical protein
MGDIELTTTQGNVTEISAYNIGNTSMNLGQVAPAIEIQE